MKRSFFVLSLLTAASAFAAEALPLFNATLTVGKEHRFVLVSAGGRTSPFLRIGETFEGYKITGYDPKVDALDLEKDGRTTRITLVGDAAVGEAKPADTKATVADAEELMRVMKFDELMKSVMEAQKKAIGNTLQQASAQSLARLGLNVSDEDKAAFLALQKEAVEDSLKVVVGPEMRNAMVKIYSETFTKQELDAVSAFYSTPAGQALNAKQPVVQEKMMGVMMPLVVQAQQGAQAKVREFTNQLRGKYGAAPLPGSPPAAAPTPSPKQ
jgi:hypothetical protein